MPHILCKIQGPNPRIVISEPECMAGLVQESQVEYKYRALLLHLI